MIVPSIDLVGGYPVTFVEVEGALGGTPAHVDPSGGVRSAGLRFVRPSRARSTASFVDAVIPPRSYSCTTSRSRRSTSTSTPGRGGDARASACLAAPNRLIQYSVRWPNSSNR